MVTGDADHEGAIRFNFFDGFPDDLVSFLNVRFIQAFIVKRLQDERRAAFYGLYTAV